MRPVPWLTLTPSGPEGNGWDRWSLHLTKHHCNGTLIRLQGFQYNFYSTGRGKISWLCISLPPTKLPMKGFYIPVLRQWHDANSSSEVTYTTIFKKTSLSYLITEWPTPSASASQEDLFAVSMWKWITETDWAVWIVVQVSIPCSKKFSKYLQQIF